MSGMFYFELLLFNGICVVRTCRCGATKLFALRVTLRLTRLKHGYSFYVYVQSSKWYLNCPPQTTTHLSNNKNSIYELLDDRIQMKLVLMNTNWNQNAKLNVVVLDFKCYTICFKRSKQINMYLLYRRYLETHSMKRW